MKKTLLSILAVLSILSSVYGVTRFYLPSSGAAAVSPAYLAWTSSGSSTRLRCLTYKISTATANLGAGPVVGTQALVQYVSDPIAGQTIGGNIKGNIRCAQVSTAAGGTIAIGIQLVDSTGGTPRTLLAVVASDSTGTTPPVITKTTYTNRFLMNVTEGTSIALTQQTAQNGDRIVIELGFRAITTKNSAVSINVGDPSSDLGENNTETAANAPWVEFDQNVILFPSAGMIRGD